MTKKYGGVVYGALLGEEHHALVFGNENTPGLFDTYQEMLSRAGGTTLIVTAYKAEPDFVGFFLTLGGELVVEQYMLDGLSNGEPAVVPLHEKALDNLHFRGLLAEAKWEWEGFAKYCKEKSGLELRPQLLLVVDEG